MGSFLSNLMGGGGEGSVQKEVESSQVIYYDSSEKWKLNLLESKASPKLIVVNFSAPWSAPCRMMVPKLLDMADKCRDVEFIRIDVEVLPDVAREFGIQAMPTFVLLKKGKEVKRLIGAKMDELESLIPMYISS